jgi:hypothetical protein
MEETKKEMHGCCETICGKWCCNGKGYIWARWILGILILAVVFSLGVKLGEFKSAIYGYGHGIKCGMYRSAYPMMFNGYYDESYGDDFGPGKMMPRDKNFWYLEENTTSTEK